MKAVRQTRVCAYLHSARARRHARANASAHARGTERPCASFFVSYCMYDMIFMHIIIYGHMI